MDCFTYRDGELHCEDVPVWSLADHVGTPAYVYSQRTFLEHYDRLSAAFAPVRPLICFSAKACPNIHLLRLLGERGAGVDTVSGGEIERAYLAGVGMDRVVFAGVGKSDQEIRAAMSGSFSPLAGTGDPRVADRGPVRVINIESEAEFETVADIARSLSVRVTAALRVNPDIGVDTHAHTATGHRLTKFGVAIERVPDFFARNGRNPHVALSGLHVHLGSPIYEPGPYVEALHKIMDLIAGLEEQGASVRVLDLGGGFGADYESETTPPATGYAEAIVPLLKERADAGMQVILEPGRTIAANAGALITRVLYVKHSGAKKFIICDAGMNTLIRPSLYDAFHFVWPARVAPDHTPAHRRRDMDMPGLEPADVVGPICETGDYLARDRRLPPVARGDLLCVFGAGAYGISMASNYNSQPLPIEVLVHGSGASIIRPRQEVAAMLAPELDRLRPIEL